MTRNKTIKCPVTGQVLFDSEANRNLIYERQKRVDNKWLFGIESPAAFKPIICKCAGKDLHCQLCKGKGQAGCECSKEKFGFEWHERWCHEYRHAFDIVATEVKTEMPSYLTFGDKAGILSRGKAK
jgi:hypothetical protein